MSTHLYKYTYAHTTHISTSILSRLDLEIHKVDQQERLTVRRDVDFH
jgi:hypothetical protein